MLHDFCFLFQIADGMAYMEREGFVHRNLGARNILVGENNNVRISGFGMTKVVDDPDFNFRKGKDFRVNRERERIKKR